MFEQTGTVLRSQSGGSDGTEGDDLQQTMGKRCEGGDEQQALARVHAVVSGLVQGVGYRYFAVTAARRLGVTGWVRNLINGDVELEAQADRLVLSEFLATMKSGNKWSRVQDVEVMAVPVDPAERNFTVIR